MEAIRETEYIIRKQVEENKVHFFGEKFSRYQKGYLWTNENIPDYLDLVDFEGKDRALCVASSGDHAFNLIERGILNVDTFDSNSLCEYLAFGLKKAMILKFEYRRFRAISYFFLRDVGIDTLTDVIKELIPYMDKKYQIYWNAILDYNYKIQREYNTSLNLIQMLSLSDISAKSYNSFIKDEESYNRLRSYLSSASITFKCANALDLPKRFKGRQYDMILLSNIPDYFCDIWGFNWDYTRLRKYEEELEGLVKENGVIFLEYMFRNFTEDGRLYNERMLIDDSRVGISDLQDEELHMIEHQLTDINDGIILKRVKK